MTTVAEKLYEALDKLSPSERRIARTLLADYPSAGLGTAAQLAAAASTSAPTVVRFAARIGFESYIAMQSSLREELTARSKSPLRRAEEEIASRDEGSELTRGGEARARLVQETFRRTPDSEVEKLLDCLAKTTNRVVIVGGQYSGFVGRIMQIQLSKLRPAVHFLEDALVRDIAKIADLRKRDVVIVFDVRRYEPKLAEVAQLAKAAGAKVALFTDQWLSPAANHADIVLQAAVDVSFLDSLVGTLALAEEVVHQAADRIPDSLERMRRIESMRS